MTAAISPDYGRESTEAPESSGYINPAIRRLVKATGSQYALDAGCGNGALCGDLAADGLTVTGIDADSRGIALARSNFPGIQFEVGTFDSSPRTLGLEGNGGFDCVVSTEVVEHLYAPHELARYAFEALRPGRWFIVTTPYYAYLKNLAFSIFDKWDHHHLARVAWRAHNVLEPPDVDRPSSTSRLSGRELSPRGPFALSLKKYAPSCPEAR